MGFFSYNCRGCGHPLLSGYATNENNGWMNEVVAISPKGIVHKGTYDGYGRIDSLELGYPCKHDVWHEACYELMDRPPYKGPAEDARDQGYFFDQKDHNVRRPKSKLAILKARNKAKKAEERMVKEDKRIQAKWDRELAKKGATNA